MKNLTFESMISNKKDLLKAAKNKIIGLRSNRQSLPLKEQNGVFYNLWASQTEAPAKQVKSQNTPIVIPVQKAAAQSPENFEKDLPVKEIHFGRKKTAVKQSSKTNKTQQTQNKILAFALSVPTTIAQNGTTAVDENLQSSLEQKATETVVTKLIQAALNSRVWSANSSGVIKVEYQIQDGALTNIKQSLGLKMQADTENIKARPTSKTGIQIFKNLDGQMWEPVKDQTELEQIRKQLNLKILPKMEMTINSEAQFDASKNVADFKIALENSTDIQNQIISGAQKEVMQTLPGGKKAGQKVTTIGQTGDLTEKATQSGHSLNTSQKETDLNIQLSLKVNQLQASKEQNAPQTSLTEMIKLAQTSAREKHAKSLEIEIHQVSVMQSTQQWTTAGHKATAAPNVLNLENVVAKIQELIDQTQTIKSQNRSINLSMEDTPIGKIDLRYHQNDKHLTIMVENEQVKNELVKFTPVIQQNLSEKGIALNGFQVNVGQFGHSKNGKHSSGKKNNQTESSIHLGKEVSGHESPSTVLNRKFGYNTMEIII